MRPDVAQSLAVERRKAHTSPSGEWMGVRFYQRGVGPVCAENHLLKHVLLQFEVTGCLHGEVLGPEDHDIADPQCPVFCWGSEEESPLLAPSRVPLEHERGAKGAELTSTLEAKSRVRSGFRHLAGTALRR